MNGYDLPLLRAPAKPLLLIDVDGVLNPIASRRVLDARDDVRFRKYSLAGYRVFLSWRHGEWLSALADRFDLAWATTWEHQADQLIAPRIGLPRGLPVITFDFEREGGKLPAVARFAGHRPCAWIDDDVHEPEQAWAAERTAAGTPTLLVVPAASVGLEARHITELEAWAAALA